MELRPDGFSNCNFGVGFSRKTPTGYELHFTIDGNLELSCPQKGCLWESGTGGGGGGILSMQKDGDLVIYDYARRRAIWSAGTKGNPGAYLAIQDDGNLVIYSEARKPLWSTGTSRTHKVV